MLTPDPVGKGTRFRETRLMFKREANEEMEVTEFDPPRRYALDAENHGCHYRSILEFHPKDGGTELRMTFEARPLTMVAKVMGFVMKPMMRGVLKECDKDLDDLKASIEGSPVARKA